MKKETASNFEISCFCFKKSSFVTISNGQLNSTNAPTRTTKHSVPPSIHFLKKKKKHKRNLSWLMVFLEIIL